MMNSDTALRRSRDSMIAGVCAGLAEYLGWPVNRFRLGYVLFSIFSAAFPGMLIYALLWFMMPSPRAQ